MSIGEAAVRPPALSALPHSVIETVDVLQTFDEVFRRETVTMVRLAFLMVRLAFLMVGSTHRAEEIVQETFAQLFERWERVQGGQGPTFAPALSTMGEVGMIRATANRVHGRWVSRDLRWVKFWTHPSICGVDLNLTKCLKMRDV